MWNQENAVNRGIQLNEAYKKLTASLSWNDGFYSNRYTWLTGFVGLGLQLSEHPVFRGWRERRSRPDMRLSQRPCRTTARSTKSFTRTPRGIGILSRTGNTPIFPQAQGSEYRRRGYRWIRASVQLQLQTRNIAGSQPGIYNIKRKRGRRQHQFVVRPRQQRLRLHGHSDLSKGRILYPRAIFPLWTLVAPRRAMRSAPTVHRQPNTRRHRSRVHVLRVDSAQLGLNS